MTPNILQGFLEQSNVDTEYQMAEMLSALRQAPINTLECLDEPNVSLFVLDPYLINENYTIEMAETDQTAISLENASDAIVLIILVMRHDPLAVTANLLGPLVINSRPKLGCQLVLENAEYSVRHLVYSETPEEGGKEDAA